MNTEDRRWTPTTKGSFVEEILTKYCGGSEAENYFSKMSSQALHQRLESLKAHAFSNSNREPDEQTANYDGGCPIDLANKTPPLGLVSSADFDPINTVGEGEFTSKPRFSQDPISDEKVANFLLLSSSRSDPITELASHNNKQFSGLHQGSDAVLVQGSLSTIILAAKTNDKDGILHPGLHSVKQTPVVVITPASMEDNSGVVENTVETNGELPAAMLKDLSDTCSLSSGCSGDELLTDDEHSDDEQVTEYKVKVSAEVFVYIFVVTYLFATQIMNMAGGLSLTYRVLMLFVFWWKWQNELLMSTTGLNCIFSASSRGN